MLKIETWRAGKLRSVTESNLGADRDAQTTGTAISGSVTGRKMRRYHARVCASGTSAVGRRPASANAVCVQSSHKVGVIEWVELPGGVGIRAMGCLPTFDSVSARALGIPMAGRYCTV